MEIKKYELYYNGDLICTDIKMGDALLVISKFVESYFNEPVHKIELVKMEKCEPVDCERRKDA